MHKKKQWYAIVALLILIGLTVAACSTPEGPAISVEDAWGRPSPKIAAAGAFYMVIKNDGSDADQLMAGESSACGTIELHESYQMDDGVMGMRPVEGGVIEIPAGEQVELKMGGLHIMCIDMLEEFNPGVKLPLTLNFEKSGNLDVEVEIREP